jgi:hypothetical protein
MLVQLVSLKSLSFWATHSGLLYPIPFWPSNLQLQMQLYSQAYRSTHIPKIYLRRLNSALQTEKIQNSLIGTPVTSRLEAYMVMSIRKSLIEVCTVIFWH